MGRTACTEPQCLYKGALYLFTFLPWESKDFEASEPGEKTYITAAHCHLAR